MHHFQDLVSVETEVDLHEMGMGIKKQHLPVVNVLSLVQYLFEDHGLHIDEAAITYFWEHARQFFEWGAGHPAVEDGCSHVPIGLYGDEAKYTTSSGLCEKIVCITMSFPLFNPRSTRNSRFLVFVIRESMSTGRNTIWPIYDYLRWCLNHLYNGDRPSAGYLAGSLPLNLRASCEGDPICRSAQHPSGCLKFALTELRGDWAWHMFALNLRNRWNSICICFKCPAKRLRCNLGESFLDFSDDAAWTSNESSHVQFLNSMVKDGPLCYMA